MKEANVVKDDDPKSENVKKTGDVKEAEEVKDDDSTARRIQICHVRCVLSRVWCHEGTGQGSTVGNRTTLR